MLCLTWNTDRYRDYTHLVRLFWCDIHSLILVIHSHSVNLYCKKLWTVIIIKGFFIAIQSCPFQIWCILFDFLNWSQFRGQLSPIRQCTPMGHLQGSAQFLWGTYKAVHSYGAPTMQCTPMGHLQGSVLLWGTYKAVHAYGAPTRQCTPVGDLQGSVLLWGTYKAVHSYGAPTRQCTPVGDLQGSALLWGTYKAVDMYSYGAPTRQGSGYVLLWGTYKAVHSCGGPTRQWNCNAMVHLYKAFILVFLEDGVLNIHPPN
jgi:hypothetical protein